MLNISLEFYSFPSHASPTGSELCDNVFSDSKQQLSCRQCLVGQIRQLKKKKKVTQIFQKTSDGDAKLTKKGMYTVYKEADKQPTALSSDNSYLLRLKH